MEEDAGVEEEESGRGRWYQGGGWSTTLALRRRIAEEDAGTKEEHAGRRTVEKERSRCYTGRKRIVK